MSLKKGQIVTGRVERVLFPGKGRVVCPEGEVLVKNVIPGRVVDVMVTKVRNGKAEGRLVDTVLTAESETTVPCEHFGVCGGCIYQPMGYDAQLALKEEQARLLLEQAGMEFEYEGIKASPVFEGYRNKMEFSFGDEVKGGDLSLGMHKRGSFHDIVTVDSCRIVDEDFRKILRCTLDYFSEHGTSFYHKMEHSGYLRHLLVRKAFNTGDILVDLVTTGDDGDGELLCGYVEALLGLTGELSGSYAGILHTRNDSAADAVIDEGTTLLYGKDYFYEELLGLKFKITPFSFFQTNSKGAEVLYGTVRDYVGDTKDKVVFDLYSGTGTIAQIVAPVAKKVIGVEIVEEAVEAAKDNAVLNGLGNCHFIAGDVLKVIGEIEDKPDILILDPPRDGIHPKALPKLIAYGVDSIVYVACKPTSLVRDLAVFKENGYSLKKAVAVDMFPGTGGIEVVALIEKQK